MHPKALAALREKINEALLAALYVDNRVVFDEEKFPALWKQTNKDLGQWIRSSDVYMLMSGYIHSALGHQERKGAPLSTLIGSEGITALADRIHATLSRLPRNYLVYIPLPNLELERDLKLAPGIDLVTVKQHTNALRNLRIGPHGTDSVRLGGPPVTFLQVRAQGWVSEGWDQSAMREASAIAKRVLTALKVKRALTTMPFFDRPATFGLFGSGFAPPYLEAIAYEEGSSEPAANAVIDPNTSNYLKQFGSVMSDTMNRLSEASPLITALTVEPADANTKSLRSAVEWAFDSAADPDPPSSFMKTCIALEAALGEENESTEITERLADRCAFLLNKTAADRATTRAEIRAIYKLRSKIVHGVMRRFRVGEEELRSHADLYLELVLHTETRAIEAWWTKLHS